MQSCNVHVEFEEEEKKWIPTDSSEHLESLTYCIMVKLQVYLSSMGLATSFSLLGDSHGKTQASHLQHLLQRNEK